MGTHRENIEADGFNLLDTRLRLIDIKLQDLIESQDEKQTSYNALSYENDATTEVYSYDGTRADKDEELSEDEKYQGIEESDDVEEAYSYSYEEISANSDEDVEVNENDEYPNAEEVDDTEEATVEDEILTQGNTTSTQVEDYVDLNRDTNGLDK